MLAAFFRGRPAQPTMLEAKGQSRGIKPAQATQLWNPEAAAGKHGGDDSSPSSVCSAFQDWHASANPVLIST